MIISYSLAADRKLNRCEHRGKKGFRLRQAGLGIGIVEGKMKKLVFVMILITAAILLSACGQGDRQAVDGLISKGDRIGGFSYTTGKVGEFTPAWDINCTVAVDGVTVDCTADVGEKVNISAGIYQQAGGQSVDEMWAVQDYGLTVGSLPVDLQSFGYVEVEHPVVNTIRMWNVVVSTDKPGAITYVDSGGLGENDLNYITTIHFVAPEK